MESPYYPIEIRRRGSLHHLIWIEGGDRPDRLAVDGDRIAHWADVENLRHFATEHGWELRESSAYDLDGVWARTERLKRPKPKSVLNAWNLFWDVATTLHAPFDQRGKRKDRLYNKLFEAEHLPRVSSPDKKYVPVWSKRELQVLRKVIAEGLALLDEAIDPSSGAREQ